MSASRLLGWVRLAIGLQRFEIVILVAGTLAYLALGWLDWVQLDSLRRAVPGCFDPNALPACSAPTLADYNTWQFLADNLSKAAWILPILVGLVLGVPIVAREIEQGTGQIAWSLSPSRSQWLLGRVLPVAALVVVALLLVGLVADRATQAAFPRDDISASFLWYGRRGLLVAVRGLAWFGIGLAVGATFGRVLPGLLLAGLMCAAVLIGTSVAISQWQTESAIAVNQLEGSDASSALIVATRVRMPDGRLATLGEIGDANVVISDERPPGADMPPGAIWLQAVTLQIPGRDYAVWQEREAGILLAIALAFGAWTLMVVTRRRPT